MKKSKRETKQTYITIIQTDKQTGREGLDVEIVARVKETE